MAGDLVQALVQTQALRVAPSGELFFYTSNTVGPYYINTHYLFGGPEAAAGLLDQIDAGKEDRTGFPAQLEAAVRRQYDNAAVYREVIDRLVQAAGAQEQPFDCVSGGERRDWFFSAMVAVRLKLPHLLLYKDGSHVLRSPDQETAAPGAPVSGWRTLHVADLVTEASSYTRAWIPMLRAAGAEMALSLNVVDRGQGGLEAIQAQGVAAEGLVRVDRDLFARLAAAGHIDPDQRQVLDAYYDDPWNAMRRFLEAHPGFLRRALESPDERVAGRAAALVEADVYRLAAG